MSDNANQSAFPIYIPRIDGMVGPIEEYGLTKRELFAAMAMQGMLAQVAGPCVAAWDTDPDRLAEKSIRCADALLIALSSPTPNKTSEP